MTRAQLQLCSALSYHVEMARAQAHGVHFDSWVHQMSSIYVKERLSCIARSRAQGSTVWVRGGMGGGLGALSLGRVWELSQILGARTEALGPGQ